MIYLTPLLLTVALAQIAELEPANLYPDNYDFNSIDPWLPNMQKDLMPPNDKMWRGSTIESDITYDPSYFKDTYGVPLQIYRGFWSKWR